MTGRVVVLDVVGLQPSHVTEDLASTLPDLFDDPAPPRPEFPALTVPAQSTLATLISEYGFHGVDTVAFPNRALRENGLLVTTDDGSGGEEVDLVGSDAFAMVDHQVAYVYADGSPPDVIPTTLSTPGRSHRPSPTRSDSAASSALPPHHEAL